MILSCQNISKSFGSEEILKQISFNIEENEKAALVGINGAGKTTLLKIIMKELEPDDGAVIIAKNRTIGYLSQYQNVNSERTIYEEVLIAREEILQQEEQLRNMELQMSNISADEMDLFMEQYHKLEQDFSLKGGYTYRSEVTGIIKGLGFTEEEFSLRINELSGGQKTRVNLGKLLVTKPDVLVLDEPTNHLDLNSISWLETFLLNYAGAVLIVSHDRYFLDRVVSKVIELYLHKGTCYLGNYSDYAVKKSAAREAMQKAYENQQREIRHQEAVITKLKSFNREKSIKRAESREKMLDKIEVLDKPEEENTNMKICLEPSIISGNDVMKVEEIAKSFGTKHLFSGISFEIKRGDRIALIGDNGTGKTTMLKMINQLLAPDHGTIQLGTNVNIGYYDQEHHVLHEEKNIFEEISDEYPQMSQTQIRNILAAFLFLEDDVFKRISDLSGGEKGRVSLAKLMLSEANFLILDEPTNHLDITSKEILEDALNRYTGTILYVSHDRYFINRTANRILELTGEQIINFYGNYDYFLEKQDVIHAENPILEQKGASVPAVPDTEQKTDWKLQKEEQAKARKKAKAMKDTEDRISELEELQSQVQDDMQDPANATNSHKLNELQKKLEEAAFELEDLYLKWEILAEES